MVIYVIVLCTKNNIHFSVMNNDKCVLKGSAGIFSFKKGKRGTLYSGEVVGEYLFNNLKDKKYYLFVKGFGKSRYGFIKKLFSFKKNNCLAIFNKNAVIFNGCRKKKKRKLL